MDVEHGQPEVQGHETTMLPDHSGVFDGGRPGSTSRDLGRRFVVTGELDVSTASAVLRQLEDLIEAGAGTITITLELGRVEFIDAAGISCLLTAKRLVEAAGGRLVLTVPAPRAHWVLDLCRVCHTLGLPAFSA